MFSKKKSRSNLRQPKIFQAPQEIVKENWSKVIFFLCLFVVMVTAFFYAVFFSSWFRIKNIEIVGSPSAQIKSDLDLMVGKNLFSFDAGEIEKKFMAIDRNYSKIKIYRGIPNTVRIIFEDREPKIIWQTISGKYFVDQSAIAFKDVDSKIKLPIVVDKSDLKVKVPTQVATGNFVDFVRIIDIELSKNKFNIVNYEVGQTTFQVTAVTDNNLRILFNALRPVSDQMDALNKVYVKNKEEIKEYLDLRVEGKVYFK
jgi:hypothetical protein